MEFETIRKIDATVDLFIYSLTQKLAWVRNAIAESGVEHAAMDAAIDDLLHRLDLLESMVIELRATCGSSALEANADLGAVAALLDQVRMLAASRRNRGEGGNGA